MATKKKLNISIDDVSPHPRSSVRVLDRCFELIDVFPLIKFTLFIPMAYTRLNEKSYYISEDKSLCDKLKCLPTENFELAWHGYYHSVPNISNNDEFKCVSYDNAIEIINSMFEECRRSGLKDMFNPILRPSAFKMSPSSFDACYDMGINILALSSKENISRGYLGKDKNFKGKVVYYNINPPLDSLNLYDRMEVVYHACEWDKSYLDLEKKNELVDFVSKNNNDIEFVFMEDI